MDYLDQAFSISDDMKTLSKQLYKESVTVLCDKNYEMKDDDAHTELSIIFWELWFKHSVRNRDALDLPCLIESNIAFNYANCVLGTGNKFTRLAKTLVSPANIVNDQQLAVMQEEMKFYITITSVDAFYEVLPQI